MTLTDEVFGLRCCGGGKEGGAGDGRLLGVAIIDRVSLIMPEVVHSVIRILRFNWVAWLFTKESEACGSTKDSRSGLRNKTCVHTRCDSSVSESTYKNVFLQTSILWQSAISVRAT